MSFPALASPSKDPQGQHYMLMPQTPALTEYLIPSELTTLLLSEKRLYSNLAPLDLVFPPEAQKPSAPPLGTRA